jgi:hypothetical protein
MPAASQRTTASHRHIAPACGTSAAIAARSRIAAADPAPMLDQSRLDWFVAMNRALHDDLDDAGFAARIEANVRLMERLAAEIAARARALHPGLDDHGLPALTGADAGGTTAALAAPLLPPVWYGLQDPGLQDRHSRIQSSS